MGFAAYGGLRPGREDSMRKIIVGSRRSKLALAQTRWVIGRLKRLGCPWEFEIREIVTKGDQILNVTLSKVGGKGLFVKEIEQALLREEIDMAVHSMKDMPAVLPAGLTIGSVPEREDPRDVFLAKGGISFRELPEGAVIGTSSLRRKAQLLALRPDLDIRWIRGNIDTRLKKLKTENYDGIILAAAGLSRLGFPREDITEYFNEDDMVPAVGQGALAVECREDDNGLLEWLAKLTCRRTERAVIAEREFLKQVGGSCQVPVGGHAKTSEDGGILFTAFVASPDGRQVFKERVAGKDPASVGREAAERLFNQGAKPLIEALAQGIDEHE